MSRKPPGFDVQVRRSGASAHMGREGELDLASAPRVQRTVEPLCAHGVDRLILDLRGVRFIDSSGLNLLLRLDAGARADGYELALVHGDRNVRRLFELT